MFGNLLDDVGVMPASDQAKPQSAKAGTAGANNKPRTDRKQAQRTAMVTSDDTVASPTDAAATRDISSAEEEFRSKKKRRQQNSKRLGLPDGLVSMPAVAGPAPALTVGERKIEIKQLADFLRDHPYLADGKSSKTSERCVGIAPAAPTDMKDDAGVNGNSNSSGSALPMDTSDAKKAASEPVYDEEILREPEEFPLLRELMTRIPNLRWLLSPQMLKQNVESPEALRYLLAKRAQLPTSFAEHDSLLVAEAGTFTSTAPGAVPGKLYNFPACAAGQDCIGVTAKVDGLPAGTKGKVLSMYMDETEFAALLQTGTAPAGERLCRDCTVITVCLLVYHVRGYAMHEQSAGATHALSQRAFVENNNSNSNSNATSNKSDTKQASFGGDAELHKKCNASLVRMADTLCLCPFTSLVNQPGGYIRECVLEPDARQYEGLIGNVVRFRASYRQWQLHETEKRWYLSQDAMIWRPPAMSADFNVDIGDALHHF